MIEYTVIYERGEINWSAYVPDLPGCVACGDTLQETEELIKEAIELYLEVLNPHSAPSTVTDQKSQQSST